MDWFDELHTTSAADLAAIAQIPDPAVRVKVDHSRAPDGEFERWRLDYWCKAWPAPGQPEPGGDG